MLLFGLAWQASGSFVTYDSLEPRSRDVVGSQTEPEPVTGKTSEFALCLHLCLPGTSTSFSSPRLSFIFMFSLSTWDFSTYSPARWNVVTQKLLPFTFYTIILAKESFTASEFKSPVLGKRSLIDPVWVNCWFLVRQLWPEWRERGWHLTPFSTREALMGGCALSRDPKRFWKSRPLLLSHFKNHNA